MKVEFLVQVIQVPGWAMPQSNRNVGMLSMNLELLSLNYCLKKKSKERKSKDYLTL